MSPRPPLPLGTWGKISRKKHSNGRWRAATRYRDTDGITRTAEAWGTSGAAAERNLVTSFQERQAPTSSEISRNTRLSELSNPVRDVGPIKIATKDVKALSVKDVQKLRTVIGRWQEDPTHQGRPRATDLLDVLDIFLATGARIGEVLAIRWQDVNLHAEPPTITISGTVVMEKGRGAYRQDHPKTKAGFRTMKVPPFAVQTLQRRHSAEQPKPEDMLFPSSTGTVRSPHNFRRQWRDARAGSPYEWVTPHVFRKSVATLIDQEYSSKQAAAQLSHSGTAITEKHYIAKATESPDLTEALQKFGKEPPPHPERKSG